MATPIMMIHGMWSGGWVWERINVLSAASLRMFRRTLGRWGFWRRPYEPHSTYEELAGHGHWLVGEPGWQDVAERVAGWLDRTLGARETRPPHTGSAIREARPLG